MADIEQKNQGGRPGEYEEKLPRIREYLFRYKETDLKEVVPSIEGLACYVPMARSTIYAWLKDETKTEFSDIIERLLSSQASLTLNSGLKGDFNSTIAKLLLSKHGYIEKSETDLTSKGEKINGIEYIVPANPNKDENKTSTNMETAPGVANTGR